MHGGGGSRSGGIGGHGGGERNQSTVYRLLGMYVDEAHCFVLLDDERFLRQRGARCVAGVLNSQDGCVIIPPCLNAPARDLLKFGTERI